MLIMDEAKNECYFLRWKTFGKIKRKGKELDPKFFNQQERALFNLSDAKEWQSFLDTGAWLFRLQRLPRFQQTECSTDR